MDSRTKRLLAVRPLFLWLFLATVAAMAFALAIPNPFSQNDWPTAMVYEFGNFIYFFIILSCLP